MSIYDVIERIGYFRNRANLSARELSLRIGKHEGYINKLESKDFNLPTKILLEIIEALNISCEEFFASNYSSYKIDNELFVTIRNLSDDRKENLLNFIKK